MNSTPINDKQSEQSIITCVETTVGQNITEEIHLTSVPESPKFDKPGINLSNNSKKETVNSDDSFDVFVPLKVKNYNNGFKKSHNASSSNKLKKKKATSSNRICPYFSARRSPTSSKEDRDLKLAIARSLEDISPTKSLGVLNDVVSGNKPIKQTSNFLKSLSSKTKKPGTNTLLFRRTKEDRQEIIIKKIGILLVEKENIHDEFLEKLEINLISSNLEEAWDKNSTLWELSKIEVNDIAEFYVSKLEKFIERQPIIKEQPVAAMPGANSVKENDNAETPAPVMDIKTEKCSIDSKENSTNLIENSIIPEDNETQFNKINENDFEFNSICTVDFNQSRIAIKEKFLNDSLNNLSNDLLALFGSSELSDLSVILKTGEPLPCHQFMLQARCPNVLSNVLRLETFNSLDFTQYSSQATTAFFKFIYSGKIDFIYSLPREDKSDLYVLAKKYKIEFLENFLLQSFSDDSFHVYSQSTCSPPESPSKISLNSNHGPEEAILDKQSTYPSLKFNSYGKEEDIRLSFANLAEALNNSASTSGLNSSKNNSQKIVPSFAEESAYDIFKDEIKSPCNSSLLSPGLQSKRKLDYAHIAKETKKLCSENISDNKPNITDIVLIDSDSNEDCLTISKNSKQRILKFDNNKTDGDLFEISSSDSSDCNITGFFSKSEEVPTVSKEVSSSKTTPSSITSNLLKSPPDVIKDFPSDKDRSIDKYFEASFPDVNDKTEILENFSQQKALFTTPVNKNISKKVLTPLQEIIIGEATPEPDYDAMVTPELMTELRKYGLKPNLEPRKAKSLLRYIYEQLHPVRATLPKNAEVPTPCTSKARTPSPVIIDDDDDDEDNRPLFLTKSDKAGESVLVTKWKEEKTIHRKENRKRKELEEKKRKHVNVKTNKDLINRVISFLHQAKLQ